MAARHCLGDGTERTEGAAVVLEASRQHFDQHRLAFELAPQQRTRRRDSRVVAQREGRRYRAKWSGMRARTKGGLPGDAESMLARLLRQTAFGTRLEFPREFPPQIVDVQDRAILPKQLAMDPLH